MPSANNGRSLLVDERKNECVFQDYVGVLKGSKAEDSSWQRMYDTPIKI